jgi:hypothetical protein
MNIPIEISMNNSKLLSQLAPFLDNKSVLADIQEIRDKNLKMNGLYERGLIEELYKYHYGYSLGFVKRDGYLKTIKKLSQKYKDASAIPISEDMPITLTMFAANRLLRKYNKNLGYLTPVLYAILCGEIKDGDYVSNTRSLVLTPEIIKGPVFEEPFEYVTLVISPESTLKEVEEVFKRTYTTYFYKNPNPFMIKKKDILKSATQNTRGKLSELRKWYWMNQNTRISKKMGYRKIAKTTGAVYETVRSGIRAYKNLIELKL